MLRAASSLASRMSWVSRTNSRNSTSRRLSSLRCKDALKSPPSTTVWEGLYLMKISCSSSRHVQGEIHSQGKQGLPDTSIQRRYSSNLFPEASLSSEPPHPLMCRLGTTGASSSAHPQENCIFKNICQNIYLVRSAS